MDEHPDDPLAHHESPISQPHGNRTSDMMQRQIDALFVHARTTAGQIADIVLRQQRVDRQMQNADSRIADLQADLRAHTTANDARADRIEQRVDQLATGQNRLLEELAANTRLTGQIKDAVTTGRVLTHALKWAGTVAAALVGLWTLYVMAAGGAGIGVGP
jgi:chromosome segregation ATPase